MYSYPPPGWDASPLQGYPQPLNYLYTWIKRGTMRVNCLVQAQCSECPGKDSHKGYLISVELSMVTIGTAFRWEDLNQ